MAVINDAAIGLLCGASAGVLAVTVAIVRTIRRDHFNPAYREHHLQTHRWHAHEHAEHPDQADELAERRARRSA
jgi:TPP-dependent pyruvate/acetoin dehydrogenase alpha subunit